DKLIELAAPFAAQLLGCDPADVRLFDGAFIAPNVGSSAVSWAELARARNRLSASARFESPLVFSSGAYAAAVEIERATGALRIVRLVAVDDAGTVINPLLVRGQVVGGAVQALGECLVEEAAYDASGQARSRSFMDYGLLTTAEIPPIVTGEV